MISRARSPEPPTPRLQPAGRRWGFGARSVLPYLNAALQARPGRPEEDSAGEPAISNPVFLHMEQALRALRQSH